MITVKELAKYLDTTKNTLFREIYERITFGETHEDRKNTLARFILGIPEIPREPHSQQREIAKHGLERLYGEDRIDFHPELEPRDYKIAFENLFEEWTQKMPGKTKGEKRKEAEEYLARQISKHNNSKYHGIFNETKENTSTQVVA